MNIRCRQQTLTDWLLETRRFWEQNIYHISLTQNITYQTFDLQLVNFLFAYFIFIKDNYIPPHHNRCMKNKKIELILMFSFVVSMFNRWWKFQSGIFYSVLQKVFRVPIQKQSAVTASLSDVKVIYDSEHFLVIDKCPDVAMNSYDKTVDVTVDKQLERMYPDLVNKKLEFSFYFAHRLDYSTTGVLCIAKHKKACAAACKAFASRSTQKYYLAIVRGTLSQDFVTVDEPIGDDTREEFRKVRMATRSMRHCSKKTREAKTHIAVLEQGICYNYPATKILLQPFTGRRHQLRLHCHHIGHTIVGDFTYSNKRDTEPYRMFLHSYRLILPNSIEKLDITARDPFTVENTLNNWRCESVVSSIDDAIKNLKLNAEK